MEICIFLGAGASAAENLPIQNELFSNYFKNTLPLHPESDMNIKLREFFKEFFYIDVLNENIDNINFPTFEEVLGILDMAGQRRESFKNFGTDTYNNQNDSINLLKQYLILLTANSINNASKASNKYHELLLSNLLKMNQLLNTTFISVNYDIHIDNTISKLYDKDKMPVMLDYGELLLSNLLKMNQLLNTTFISVNYDIHIDNTISKLYDKDKMPVMLDYGVDFANFNYKNSTWLKPTGQTIKLYKIHGSLNWLYCPVCSSLTLTPYEGGVMRILNNQDEATCLNCNQYTIPIIVPPTYFKNMSNVYLSSVWNKAEASLRKSDVIIFCGYSFPEADMHIKYMLKRVQTSRNNNPLKIIVFNNHENKLTSALKKEEMRYKRFLGEDIIFTNESFQDFATNPYK